MLVNQVLYLDHETLLRLASGNPATGVVFQGFAEDRIGALDPGKQADFILVDRDISRVSPGEMARTQVLETWIGGKKVWARQANAAATPVR